MRLLLTTILASLCLSTSALADRPEAGALLGFTQGSAGGFSATGWALGLRGGYRMDSGLTPDGMLGIHNVGGGSQVLLGGGARYYFVAPKEQIQPFAAGQLQLATKSPSALGIMVGGGAQYRINKDFFAEGMASYHLSLGDAFNWLTIGVGGGMKF